MGRVRDNGLSLTISDTGSDQPPSETAWLFLSVTSVRLNVSDCGLELDRDMAFSTRCDMSVNTEFGLDSAQHDDSST